MYRRTQLAAPPADSRRMSRPGPLAVAIAAAVGIALAPWLARIGVAGWQRGLVGAALVLVWRRNASVILLAGLAAGVWRGGPSEDAALAGADDRIVDRVTGVIEGPIVHGPRGDGARLAADGATVWLWSGGRLHPGEQVVAIGRLHAPRGLRDPAVPDRAALVHARGASLELTAQEVIRLGDAGGWVDRAWRAADDTQRAWVRALDAAGGGTPGAAALRGIVAGDRGEVPPALDDRWRAVGIFHVLSVSGLHLAVVSGLAFWLLRRLIAMSPWGGRCRPARWASIPALALAIAYTMITGAQLATLRSLAVIACMLIGQLCARPVKLLDATGFAALAILIWRPADLFDPSFQLSFVAAITLALQPPVDASHGVRGWLVRGALSSARVALTTAPLTAYHFQQVAVGGVLGNLVLTPAVELIALPLGLAGAALGLSPAITAAAWIVGLADRGAGLLAQVTPVGHVAVASGVVTLALVAISLYVVTRERWARGRIAGWVMMCAIWAIGRTPPPDGALRMTFLDVGQGDAALIELPDGQLWLLDAGGAPNARDLAAAAATGQAIDRVVWAYGHARIDLAILSHPHPDHYLGLAAITTPITELWVADEPGGNGGKHADRLRAATALPGFAAIAAGLVARGTRLVHPQLGTTAAGEVSLRIWAPRYQPADRPMCAADPVRSLNDNSLVVELGYRGRRVLFAGDVEAEGEADLVAAGVGPVDVVKVPHHGSPTSSSPALVAATRPRLAVISCGRGNAFGFPSPRVIARWQAAGAEVARTDTDGAVTVTIDERGGLMFERYVP
ncbi:MAG TPA: ComEC/Rec2 family competence protein [Kofleriaceae bacterium]